MHPDLIADKLIERLRKTLAAIREHVGIPEAEGFLDEIDEVISEWEDTVQEYIEADQLNKPARK